jgi:hypothetical protein
MIITKRIILLILFISSYLFAQPVITDSENIPWLKRSLPTSNTKFTFAILGDKTGGGEENWPIFDRAVDEINLLKPDFVVMVGDLIQGYVSDQGILDTMWQEFFRHANRLQVPLFMVPGNHDISNEIMYDYWKEHFGKTYYSFLYNNSLFIILNTEENKKVKTGQFGEKQVEFLRQQFEKFSNVDHFFIFMHKPVWNMDDPGKQEWQQIASWYKDKKCNVFAGHRHNLQYDKKDGQRYMVLSATGGRLSPNPADQMGYFHHYSLVTVEPDTALVTIIKPGNILAENIASADFIAKAKSIVSLRTFLDSDLSKEELSGNVTFKFTNQLNETILVEAGIMVPEGSGWHFAQQQIRKSLDKGDSLFYEFSGTCQNDLIYPFPQAYYTVVYQDKPLLSETRPILPQIASGKRSPREVTVIGPFDLGIAKRPPGEGDPRILVPRLFEQLEPEKDPSLSRGYKTLSGMRQWQNVKMEGDVINFDPLFGEQDFAIAYAQFIINSPESMRVLGGIRPDNFCKVIVNGTEIYGGHPLRGVQSRPDIFVLPLKEGENRVLFKTADYPGNWYVEFWVVDPHEKLIFE